MAAPWTGQALSHSYPDIDEMRRRIFSVSISDTETRRTMKRVYKEYGTVLEPHGAVGWRGLEIFLDRFGDFPLCVSLETAHPAKFPDDIISQLKITPELPPSMQGIEARKGEAIELAADYATFKKISAGKFEGRRLAAAGAAGRA